MKRRDFLKGCCAAAVGSGVMPMTGVFNPLAFGASRGGGQNVLVYLFLRGGLDGLHLVVPYSGPERVAYDQRRGALNIDPDILRPLGNSGWALHPRAGGEAGYPIAGPAQWLLKLWEDGHLAIIHGAGMPTDLSRSHFDAQAWMDLGTPGDKTTSTGWLARYLQQASGLPPTQLSHAFGFASTQPLALLRAERAFTVLRAQDFRVNGFPWSWNEPDNDYINGAPGQILPLWQSGDLDLDQAGRLAAEALRAMREIDFAAPDPDDPAAPYPNNTFGAQLKNLAQLIKQDTGLAVATVDYGGWDTHEGQGRPTPANPAGYDYFGNRLEGLARGLNAFWTDLAGAGQGDLTGRVSIVMLSEFGRNISTNISGGTDHGYGNVMLALGGGVDGGFHGQFPGLDKDSDFEGQDLAVTTDFRQILAEALVRRMDFPQNQLGQVFPDFDYSPLGVFQ